MKKKSIFILLIIFAALVAVAIIVEGPMSNRDKKKAAKESILFPGFDADQVSSVEITTPERNVKLSRENDSWVVATADNYSAAPEAIEEMMEAVKDLKLNRIASKSAEKYSQFRVDEAGVEVKMLGAGEDVLAHFIVGKPGPDYVFSTYIRKADREEVLLVDGSVRTAFDKGSRGWRDRTIMKFDPTQVQRLTLISQDKGEIAIEAQENGDWQIIKPEVVPADRETVDEIVRDIANLSADDFAEKKELQEYKLDEPPSKFMVDLKDGTSRIVLFGDEANRQFYVKSEGKDVVFTLSKTRTESIFRDLEALKAQPKEAEEEAGKAEGEQETEQ